MMTVTRIRSLLSSYRSFFLLFLIFLFALALRMYDLGSLPFGLHEDEMMNGYVGRFILLNGKDLYGNRWPLLYFNNFGDYPPVLPMYLSGISTFIFGVNEFAIRLPIALAGSLTVFPLFFLVKQIFQKERYAFAIAGFFAILPWSLILSRATAENVTGTFIFLTMLYSFLLFRRTRRLRYLLFTIALTILTYFLYATFRVTTPLFFLGAFFLARDIKWRLTVLSLLFLFSALTFGISQTTWGQGRFHQTSILYFNNTVSNRITNMETEEGDGKIFVTRLFHNKIIVVGREFVRQYVSYFSPNFLLTDGGLPHRYLLEDLGLLYYAFAAMCILAILRSIFQKNEVTPQIFKSDGLGLFAFLLFLLAVAPIPAALTLDDIPNIHRSYMFGVFLLFPITLAFAHCEQIKWKKFGIQAALLLLLCGEVVYFWHQFSVHTIAVQSEFRGDDRTTLAHFLAKHHTEYDQIYLPNDAKPLYYLLYTNNFQESLAGKFDQNIRLSSVDNLIFTQSNCANEVKGVVYTNKSLVINRDNCIVPYGLVEFDQIQRADGSGSFRLLRPLPSTK